MTEGENITGRKSGERLFRIKRRIKFPLISGPHPVLEFRLFGDRYWGVARCGTWHFKSSTGLCSPDGAGSVEKRILTGYHFWGWQM